METAAPVLTKPGVYFPHEPGLHTCLGKSLAKAQIKPPHGFPGAESCRNNGCFLA